MSEYKDVHHHLLEKSYPYLIYIASKNTSMLYKKESVLQQSSARELKELRNFSIGFLRPKEIY